MGPGPGAAPGAGCGNAVDMAVHRVAGEHVDGNIDLLAFAHIRELGFLVVGIDEDVIQRHLNRIFPAISRRASYASWRRSFSNDRRIGSFTIG